MNLLLPSDKMSVIRICVFLYLGLLQNVVHSTIWVDDLTRFIVRDSEFYQVKLITRLVDNETLGNSLIDELSVKLMHHLPMIRIDIGDVSDLPTDSVADETGTIARIDTAATLFILVIESRQSLPISASKNLIDVVAKMADYHNSPKYLMISFVRLGRDSLEELLRHAWKNKMLDFTVIELVESASLNNSILTNGETAYPIVHQLNPFKGEYSRANGPANMKNLFPNKVSDMNGYDLIVMGSKSWEPTTDSPMLLQAPLTRILEAIFGKLNCGASYVPSVDPKDGGISVYSAVEKNSVDLSVQTYPFYFQGWNDTQRTKIVEYNPICPLVPLKPRSEVPEFTNLIKAYALSIGVVTIFWIFMRFLRLNTYSSRMFNIGRVLFGISVTQQPRVDVERIIFTCLLALCAVYSSTIFGAITDISFQEIGQIEYKSLEDLDSSELTPWITEADFNRASSIFDGPLKKLSQKLVVSPEIYDCIKSITRHEKTMCFMDKKSASFMKKYIEATSDVKTKVLKTCFWNEPFSFIVGKRSPYRSYLDKLILRLHSSGIGSKKGFVMRNKVDEKPGLDERIETTSPLRQLLAISIAGYSLSILAFIGEIIVHRVSLYIRSRKQARNASSAVLG